MPNIEIALTNTGGESEPAEVARFLANQIPSSTFDTLPSGPGMKRGYDIVGVIATISTMADIQSLANGLWLAYEAFIKPHQAKNPTSALALRVQGHDGKYTELMIDGSQAKEVIVENLRATSSSLSADSIRIKR